MLRAEFCPPWPETLPEPLELTDSEANAWPFPVLLKNRFLALVGSYCQISTDLDKILHTPIEYGIHLWADLDRDRRVASSRPNQNDYVSL